MNLLSRMLLLIMATLLLAFAVVISSAFVLVSAIRWLVTGKKPSLVLYAQAYKRWKHMAAQADKQGAIDDKIIDVVVREVTGLKDRLRQ